MPVCCVCVYSSKIHKVVRLAFVVACGAGSVPPPPRVVWPGVGGQAAQQVSTGVMKLCFLCGVCVVQPQAVKVVRISFVVACGAGSVPPPPRVVWPGAGCHAEQVSTGVMKLWCVCVAARYL